MCVSLVTSYYCRRRHRREIVQLANRYLLRAFGVRDRSTAESGLRSKLKRILFRTLNKCMTFKKRYDFTDSYVTNLRVNLDHPQCIERTASIIAPDFCNKNSKKKAADSGAVQVPNALRLVLGVSRLSFCLTPDRIWA